MIIGDKTSQLSLILPQAATFLEEHDLTTLENGRYDLGDGHFANVSSYDPVNRDSKDFEAHRNYADIQMVFEGMELMEVAPYNSLTTTVAYSDESDCEMLAGASGNDVLLAPGVWALVMPEDAHKPGIAIENHKSVRKIVFKMHL